MDFFNFVKENKFIILLISILANIILLLSTGFLLYLKLTFECEQVCDSTCNNIFDSTLDNLSSNILDEEVIEKKNKMFVEVKGAVNKPGVFEVDSNNIINDVITLAGGFTKSAYTNNINLSRKVSDELVIYVYTSSEYKKKSEVTTTQDVCSCPSYDISDCTDKGQSEITSSNTVTNNSSSSTNQNTSQNNNSSSEKVLVNINTASKDELMKVSGIGESKANSIIEYRNTNGLFKNIDEIKNVSGIGDALFEKIKDYITV